MTNAKGHYCPACNTKLAVTWHRIRYICNKCGKRWQNKNALHHDQAQRWKKKGPKMDQTTYPCRE